MKIEGKNASKFGKNGEFVLGPDALDHILKGNFSVRPLRGGLGKKSTIRVLAGGLHTWTGWKAFLGEHSEIAHLADFDTLQHAGWFFARELQNGVITLKIPRELFSKDAASITMMPDVHYKSGYLWKTLFPTHYTRDDILEVIQEALLHVDEEDSLIDGDQRLVIGYARAHDPFAAIRIRIQLHGNEIRSAFPTWDQPNTGNNGKSYSQEHAIGFHIAESTIGSEKTGHRTSYLFKGTDQFHFMELIKLTPDFVLERARPVRNKIQDFWRETRKSQIEKRFNSSIGIDTKSIVTFLQDYCIAKEPFAIQCQIYRHLADLLEKYPGMLNIADVVQNVSDCYFALMLTDNRDKTRLFLDMAIRHLAMGVIHAGGLNLLEAKRMIKMLIECSMLHHARDAFACIVENLADSPLRSALFSEFNVNPYLKENTEDSVPIIGVTKVEMALGKDHLADFVSISLGETYLLNFSKEERDEFAMSTIKTNYPKKIIDDSLIYFVGSDFDFFTVTLADMGDIGKTKDIPSESSLISITREYSRMLVAYRQRIVMEDFAAYEADPYDYKFGSEEQFLILKQQHKRTFVLMMHESWLKEMSEFSLKVNYLKLNKRASHILAALSKERVPLPKRIPAHIPNWTQDPTYKLAE